MQAGARMKVLLYTLGPPGTQSDSLGYPEEGLTQAGKSERYPDEGLKCGAYTKAPSPGSGKEAGRGCFE